jgi:hypothetical protein
MPEHYNDRFYDELDDLLLLLGSTFSDIEARKEDIAYTIKKSKADPQMEIDIVKSFLANTCLAKTIPTLDGLIAMISSSLLEEFKVYSHIDEKVQRDISILEDCKKEIVIIVEQLEELNEVNHYKEAMIDHLERKLSNVNIFILDTFYS